MKQITQTTVKPPLSHEELTDIIELALWSAQLLLQHGADNTRTEETAHKLGTGLGCNWLDVLITPESITVTATSAGEFRTKIRRVTRVGTHFGIIDTVNDISYRVMAGEMDRFQVREALARASVMPHNYNRWVVVGMVGLACAAFARLFGADLPVMAVTFFAAAVAMFVRQVMTQFHLNGFLTVVTTAFVAASIASMAMVFKIGDAPQTAQAAAVLLLVPGVPLINAAEDILQGHVGSALMRAAAAALIALGIALGLSLAIGLTGVRGV